MDPPPNRPQGRIIPDDARAHPVDCTSFKVHPKTRSSRFRSNVSACERLITHEPSPSEVISLIGEIFSSKDEVKLIGDLRGDHAQTFIDVIDQALDHADLPSHLRRKCLSALRKICGSQASLPSSLKIPLRYDRSGVPLCRGGFADVWKGKYQGRDIAVKVLRVDQTSDSRGVASRFCKEVVTWKALHHPNVLPLLGVMMDDSISLFAMASEWMANGNIVEFIKAHRDANRFELLKDVARGLIYMHDQEMIHGDLKGANILIDKDAHARLADFGFLTIISDTANTSVSSSSLTGGTIGWMSPELLDPDQITIGGGRQTKKSDSYALGMVILEVLSGEAPFKRFNEATVIRMVIEGRHPERPKGTEGAFFTNDLWEALNLCWEYRPESRPSAEAILEALERVSRTRKPPLLQADSCVEADENDITALDDQERTDKSSPPQFTPQRGEKPHLNNGTKVDYDDACRFIDYYTRRFSFSKYIEYNLVSDPNKRRSQVWEAVITIGGNKVGFGRGFTKKLAQESCYVDATVYIEACDPGLWRAFVGTARTGRDLGTAPPVYYAMSEALGEDISDLCMEMEESALYRNALKSWSSFSRPGISQAVHGVPPLSRPQGELFSFEERNRVLKEKRERYLRDPAMESVRNSRAALPIATRARELLDHIWDNDVTICVAATGSGKTTEVPQLILDDYIDRGEGSRCNIICTQPRRFVASSVALQVARERGEDLGDSIGYQVHSEEQLPEGRGSVTFCTIGTFLKRMQPTPETSSTSARGHSLDDVTHILVDDVHERNVDTDLLLVVLKRLIADRKERGRSIKAVLISDTGVDPTLFQRYFPDDEGQPAGVIEVPCPTFPVRRHFLDEFLSDLASIPGSAEAFAQDSVAKYIHNELGHSASQLLPPRFITTFDTSRSESGRPPVAEGGRDGSDELELPIPLVALTIAHVLRTSNDGHVLAFLPGWDEIQSLHQYLANPASNLGFNFHDQTKWTIHNFHSTVSAEKQQAILGPSPEGIRRIILATNVAETSVTVPGVVYVVDTAKIREKFFDPERRISSLSSVWVCSSSLNKRAGRAGMRRPGEYFGIISRKHASELHPHQIAEMRRVDLSNVVMQAKSLDLPGISTEDLLSGSIAPPAAERVAAAINNLTIFGALDAEGNLTPLGNVLLQLPVDVGVGRLMLLGAFFKCLDNALTLAAILTNRDPFMAPKHLRREGSAAKISWTSSDSRSDVLATLNAYNAWWEKQRQEKFSLANKLCSDNFLSKQTLLTIRNIKEHLLRSLYRAGVIDVSMGMPEQAWADRAGVIVPPELDVNRKSTPLLVALISVASRPNFAVRTGDKTYRTSQDKQVCIHPSSVNHLKKGIPLPDDNSLREKWIVAFAEKRQNNPAVTNNAQTFIVTTTRLDPMSYILFGAHDIHVSGQGLKCDGWLPIVGDEATLGQVSRLKKAMELCFLRVYEGIIMTRPNRHGSTIVPQRKGKERYDERRQGHSLSSTEVGEFEIFTRNLVYILNQYNDERIASQSLANSRPATPMDSPYSIRSRTSSTRSGTSAHHLRPA